jgi:Zn-finger nucleic acid-binding protein
MNPACPACATATRIIQWRDLAGFECPGCRGHLVRAKPLERFLDEYGPEKFGQFVALVRDAPPSARPLTCPGCGTRSYRALRRGVVEIDVCASCGCVYFDEGEATSYLRQAVVKKFGREALDVGVTTADGLDTLLELIINLLD